MSSGCGMESCGDSVCVNDSISPLKKLLGEVTHMGVFKCVLESEN
jgi:hypothetical protein